LQNPLRHHLNDFVDSYHLGAPRSKRLESERLEAVSYDALMTCGEASLDLTCLLRGRRREVRCSGNQRGDSGVAFLSRDWCTRASGREPARRTERQAGTGAELGDRPDPVSG
jgi:hypothetical protein